MPQEGVHPGLPPAEGDEGLERRAAAAHAEHLVAETRREDVVVILSNGGFGGIHAKLLAALDAKT